VLYRAEIPELVGRALNSGKRYIVLHGGRGSGKTQNIARQLLLWAVARPIRVLCTREVMNSISESVYQTLVDEMETMGIAWQFDCTGKAIRHKENGAMFWFAGLRTNIDSLKSKAAVDIVWVEEGHGVRKKSWDKLIPTIRKSGSQIIVSFNPELETDDTYQRFIVRGRGDPDVELCQVNWRDNPFFPAVLEAERQKLMAHNYDEYLHVYEGHTVVALEGAVYAKELREAKEAGRITKVPYRAGIPVVTAWDLGWRDFTSIWFAQRVGFEYAIIDYEEARGKKVPEFLQLLQSKGYVYGRHYLPHDGAHESIASNSVQHQMLAAGLDVVVLDSGPGALSNGINATRSLFPQLYFDEENCADGLNRLRRYCYKVDEKTGVWSPEPLHDENSHPADALRYLAQSLREPRPARPRPRPRARGSWMGG